MQQDNTHTFACPICGRAPVCISFSGDSFLVSCPSSCISGDYKEDCLDAWNSYRDVCEQVLSHIKEEGLANG